MKLSNILFLICLVSALIACGGAEERKAAYLEKAEQSLKIGDLDKARIELKNVLQIDPKDARAHFKLGRVYEGKKNFSKAFGHYLKATELDDKNSKYHGKIGQFYLILARDVDKAIEQRDIILANDKESIEGLLLKAGILFQQKKKGEAEIVVESVFSAHPEHVQTVMLLSSYYSNDKQYKKALEVIKTGLQHNPEHRSLRNALAKTLYFSGDYQQAEVELKSILDADPDSYNNYLKLANFYQKTGRSDDAISTLKSGIANDSSDVKRQLVLAQYIHDAKGVNAAITEVNRLINDSPQFGELKLAVGKLYVANGDSDKAEKVFLDTVSKFSEDESGIKARIHLANIYIQERDKGSANKIIDDAVTVAPSDPIVNIIKAKLALLDNNIEQAIISLRVVIKSEPNNIEAYLLLAAAHKANNESDQADEIVAQAYETNRGDAKALLDLAKYHVKKNDAANAEKVIDSYLALDKDNYEALTIKATVLTSKRKFEDASEYIDRLLLLYPTKENGYLQKAVSLMSDNKGKEVLALLEDGFQKTNHGRKILAALTKLQVYTKDFDVAIKRLKAELNDSSDDAEIYMGLSNVYIASSDFVQAEKNLKKVIEIKSDATQPYLLLSKIYLREKRKKMALSILNDGLLNAEDKYAVSLSIAGLHALDENYDSAIATYEDILKKNPDKVIVINNLAALLSDHRTDEASLSRAKELADRIKGINQPATLDTAGWVYYKVGNYDDAVTTLKKAVDLAPENAVFNYHLGMAYYKENNNAMAKVYLSKAIEGDTKFDGRDDATELVKTL